MLAAERSIATVLHKMALTFALSVAGLGLLVLIGWATHFQPLKSLNPGWVTMKPNTALGFCLSGISLSLALALPQNRNARRTAIALAAIVWLMAVATEFEFLSGMDLRIDEWLFRDDPNPVSTAIPGRMAIRTLWLFIAFSSVLIPWLLARARIQLLWLAQIVSLMICLCSLAGVVTYLFGGITSNVAVESTPIAYHTALCFVLLGVALFLADPEKGLARIFSRDDLGGMTARRLTPIMLIAPIVIGYLRHLGEENNLFTPVMGVVLSALLYVVLFSLVVIISAAAISRLEFQRRKAVETQQRVFTLSQDLICVANFQGYFLQVNPAFETALGYTAAELTARPYLEFIHPEDRNETSHEADRNAANVKSLRFENRYMRKDGRAIYLSWSATPYPEEGLIFASARDVTDEKMRLLEIQRLNDRLAHKISELGDAIKELEAFSYSVSHDLRAPLRHIDGYLELLRGEVGAKLDEKSLRYMSTIEVSAKKMGQLIDALLAFSRMGRAALATAPVDSAAMVEEILTAYRGLPGNEKVTWKIGALPALEADPTMLRQVWINLIENALKYSHTRAVPVIELGGRVEGQNAVFFVKDNGVGFDPQYTHKLFGVFQRLHSMREFDGTGIGLANVHRIVTRHAGRVWAEGILDGGATFYFSLPQHGRPAYAAKVEEVVTQ